MLNINVKIEKNKKNDCLYLAQWTFETANEKIKIA